MIYLYWKKERVFFISFYNSDVYKREQLKKNNTACRCQSGKDRDISAECLIAKACLFVIKNSSNDCLGKTSNLMKVSECN